MFRNGVVAKKCTTMKKTITPSLVLILIIINGCKPSAQPVDIHPTNLVGSWKAEFTTKIHPNLFLPQIEKDADATIGITIKPDGSANFQATESIQHDNVPQTETVSGSWKQLDDYLIVQRPNGDLSRSAFVTICKPIDRF